MENRKRIVKTVIDIGNRKLKGIIGEMTQDGVLILEQADVISSGIERSSITNTMELSGALGALIEKLKKANRLIDKITIGVGGKTVKTKRGEITYEFDKKQITEEDVENFLEKAKKELLTSREVLLHKEIYNIKVDNIKNIKSPVGRIGSHLQADVYLIYMERDEYRKYDEVCSKLNLKIENVLASSYASALSTLRLQDRKNGVVLVDIGESSTDIVIYAYDRLIFLDSIQVGTMHYINDITYLPTYVEYKTRHTTSGEKKTLSKKAARDIFERYHRKEIALDKAYTRDGLTYMGDYIREIIDYRNTEVAGLIKELITNSGFAPLGKKITITGGGANIDGLEEKISQITQKNTKKILPIKIPGLKTNNTNFASVIGLFGDAIDKVYQRMMTPQPKEKIEVKLAPVPPRKSMETPIENPVEKKGTKDFYPPSNTTTLVKPTPVNSINPIDVREVEDPTAKTEPNKGIILVEPTTIKEDPVVPSIDTTDPEDDLKKILEKYKGIDTANVDNEEDDFKFSKWLKNGIKKVKEWTENFE